MGWLNTAGTDLGGVLNNLTNSAEGLATATHTLLGSGGTIYENGEPLISTGVTAGDVVTTRQQSTHRNISEIHGLFSELTSSPIILGIIVLAFVILVAKK